MRNIFRRNDEVFRIEELPEKEQIRVFFIGQPNVGKSSLLNALVGTKIEVSNYPGTSVEITSAEKQIGFQIKNSEEIHKIDFVFTDTPGIYSLSDQSPEETITKETLLSAESDIIVLILSATSLDRGLYFVLQLLELGKNTIIGLNFVEEARKKGITIDSKKLSKALGIDVVSFNPITGDIVDLICKITEKSTVQINDKFDIIYDDYIENLISTISAMVDTEYNDRFVSLRILEEDDDFLPLLTNEQQTSLKNKKNEITSEHPNIKEEISKTRYSTAAFIAQQVTQIKKIEKGKQKEKPFFDKILLHQLWGPLFTLLFFVGLFFVLLYLGGFIEGGFVLIGEKLIQLIPEDKWLIGNFSFLNLIREGLAGASAGIAIALPYVFLFYLILGVTEDVGLLPRFVLNIARFFEFFGLPSRGFIPMILNIGCTVPAIASTRIIKRKSDRIKVAFMFAFIPCSSRIAIIMGVVGFYGGVLLALALFGTLILALMIWALITKLIWKTKPEPLLIELPAYRKPFLKNILGKSWLRMNEFIKVVIPLLVVGGVLFSILDQLNVTGYLIQPFDPITRFLFNLPGETIIPILFGFLQKDLVGSMLISSLGTSSGVALTNMQLFTFGLVTCIGIPCIIALGMMIREFKVKETLLIFFPPIIYGIILSSVIWRIIGLF